MSSSTGRMRVMIDRGSIGPINDWSVLLNAEEIPQPDIVELDHSLGMNNGHCKTIVYMVEL